MAAHEIKTRFKLEGEQEYKRTMTDAANAIKVLNSEQKLAAAEFENSGDAQQYAATQARILKEQIANQQKAVAAAEAAIKALTENGVSPSSKEFQTWRTRLNNSKTALTKMETQLASTEGKMDTQTTATAEASTSYSNAETKIKSLTAEEKLAEAQFKATGDQESYAATKTTLLKQKIAEQEKAVAAAEAAIKSMTENGVDPNSEEMIAWKTKLANAKTSLTNMKTELGNVEGELGDQTTALGTATEAGGEYKDQLDKIGKGFDINNTITAIDSITEKISGAAKAAARAAKAIWDMGADAGAWADDLLTTASQMGVDVETLQSWQYASRFIDTSVEDISRSWQDLTKRIKDGDTNYLAALAEMGVASMNVDGTMRESQDIFWDMIDALHNMEDPQARAAAATKMFGNDWRNLNPLIEEGSQAYKDLAAEGADVAVVSEDNVKALGAADDAMQKMQASFDKMKLDALAALAPTFEQVANSLSTAITALDQFIQTEEGQQMLSSLNEALSGIINSIVGENGEGFAKIINTAKGAVEGLTGALDWISKNGDTVAGILGTIAAAFAGLKVSSTVLQFVKLANGMKGIFGGGAAGAGASGAGAAGAGASGAAGAAGAGASGAGAAGAGIGAAFADAAVGIGAAGLVTAAAVLPAILVQNAENERTQERLDQLVEKATANAEGKGAQGAKALQAVTTAADALGMTNGVIADPVKVDAAIQQLKALDDGMMFTTKTTALLNSETLSTAEQYNVLNTAMEEAAAYLGGGNGASGGGSLSGAISDALDILDDARTALEDGGKTVENIEGVYAAIDAVIADRKVYDQLSDQTKALLSSYYDPGSGYGIGSATQFSDAQSLLDTLFAELDTAYERAKEAGSGVSEGMTYGIESAAGDAAAASSGLANGVIDAAAGALDEHSPSKVFEGIGENAAIGLANGIYAQGGAAISAALWLARSVENIVRSALQIHSPSAVFADLGDFVGEGFAEGISGSARTVERAVDTMLNATTKRPIMAVGGYSVSPVTGTRTGTGGGASGDPADMVNVTLVLDEEVLGSVMAPIVNDKIGAKIQATRR